MVDYTRFDKIDTSSDEDSEPEAGAQLVEHMPQVTSPAAAQHPPVSMTTQGKDGRLKFEHQGTTIYEWEQTLEDVAILVKPPPGVRSSMIDCVISHTHVRLGLKGNPPFLDEDTGGPIKSKESFWMLEDGEVHIHLQKMNKGEMWASALAGRGQMDPFTSESVKKKMMLERFQEENPGFDFSNAEFNGAVPDPRSFTGGVRYS